MTFIALKKTIEGFSGKASLQDAQTVGSSLASLSPAQSNSPSHGL
jgi:hypothetical protein